MKSVYKKRNNRLIIITILLFFLILIEYFFDFLKYPSNFLKDILVPFYEVRKINISNKDEFILWESIEKKELESEVAELKDILSLNNSLKEYVNASTIYRSMNTFNDYILVDAGSNKGIKSGMSVINLKGVIGRVKSVSNNTSLIELLCTSKKNKVSVKIDALGNYIYGILDGYDYKEEAFKISGISSNLNIPRNSIVTTTDMGTFFKGGLLVGKVSGEESDHFDLTKTILVKSDVNFSDINIVTILKEE